MGMAIAHIMASCMGGIRTAGDLVAWMQMTRKMKINEAKAYVAEKLGIDVIELTNEEVMRETQEGPGTRHRYLHCRQPQRHPCKDEDCRAVRH